MRTKTIILWILLLTAIDQLIKIIISTSFMEYQFDIIPSLLSFKPTYNSNYSYLNDLLNKKFDFDLGFLPHIILYLFLVLFVLNLYLSFKIKLKSGSSRVLDFALIFQVSAIFCALSGNIIWEKGVLDYIYLKPLVIFDLKDMYVNAFVALFGIYVIKNRKDLHDINLSPKDVIAYIKERGIFAK